MFDTFDTYQLPWTISLTYLAFCVASAQQESCSPIGNKDETAATPSRDQGFYLNTAYPAPCTGNITSWRVCYYGPNNVAELSSYWATYAVYRRMGSDDDVRYERVSEMFRATRAVSVYVRAPGVDGEIVEDDFICYVDSIDTGNSPPTVQAGDILGACVFDPENIRGLLGVNRLQLDIVGVASGQSLLQMGTTGCTTEAIPLNIPANQLSTQNSRRLHLYADIGKLTLFSAQSRLKCIQS